MLRISLISIWLFIYWLGKPAFAQSIKVDVRHYSSAEGLKMPMVNDLFLDRDGYIWLATFGGLARFDGSSFSNFEPEGGEFKSVNFTCIASDENGNLWTLGQDERLKNRLFVFDKAEKRFYPVENRPGLSSPSNVRALVPLKEGVFLLVTQAEEVFQYQFGQFKFLFQSPEQTPIRNLKQIDEELFIKNAKQEIYKLEIGSGSTSFVKGNYTIDEPANFQDPRDFKEPPTNAKGTDHFFSANPSLLPHPVYPFDADTYFYHQQETSQVFWTLRNKSIFLQLAHTDTWNDFSYLIDAYPKAQGIKCSLIDDYNQLWIGTNDGIFAFKTYVPFFSPIFQDRDDLGNAYSFRGITKWQKGIYASSYSGKMKYNPTNGQKSPFFMPREKGHLLAAHTGYRGELWMSNMFQLQRFIKPELPPVIYELPTKPTIPRDAMDIWEIYEDENGKVWLGTSVGLAVLDSLEGQINYLPSGSESVSTEEKIHHILPFEKGLCLATSGGLTFYHFESGYQSKEEGIFLLQKHTEGIPIYHIHKDSNGDFWMATHGKGLLHWSVNEQKLAVYDRAFGFSNEYLHAVYEDEKGGLWIPSENGLFLFDKKEKNAIRFDTKHGLTDDEFNRISHYRDEDGNLYFGGVAGISAFHPSQYYVSISKKSPLLNWESAQLSNEDGGSTRDISVSLRGENPIPLNSIDSRLKLKVMNLGGVETFEYKWKSDEEGWVKAYDPILNIPKLPRHQDELLIRGFDKYGFVSEVLSIPFHWEYKNNWNRQVSLFFVGGGIFLVIYYLFIRFRKPPTLPAGDFYPKEESSIPHNIGQATISADGFVEKLEEITNKCLASPEFGVNELSEALCISRKSLYRKIKQHTGKTPNEYIRDNRLEYARKLLRSPELNISEITYKAGFGSTSYFSNCYKKHFGVTPKEDRKKWSGV